MGKTNTSGKFLWRVTSSHVIAYFLAGLFAVTFMGYREHFVSDTLSLLMRPVDSPLVSLGMGLQVIRGLIIALCLLPIKNALVEEKNGFLKLALLVFGLSSFASIGPSPGSFEGIVYTIVPLQYHLMGIPEVLLYVFLLTFLIWIYYRVEKKWLTILSIAFVLIICAFSILGFLANTGNL